MKKLSVVAIIALMIICLTFSAILLDGTQPSIRRFIESIQKMIEQPTKSPRSGYSNTGAGKEVT